MAAVVVRTRRMRDKARGTVGLQGAKSLAWVLVVGVVGAVVAIGGFAHSVSKQTSSARPAPQYLPPPAPAVLPSSTAEVRHEVHRVALAFAAALASGENLTKPAELVPRYLKNLPESVGRLGWNLEGYTLRSKAVDAKTCEAASNGSGPFLAEQASSGLHCYTDVAGALRLAYRLEPIAEDDKRWQQVRLSLSLKGHVPHLAVQATSELLPSCEPTVGPSRITLDTTHDGELATRSLCFPAWSWEGAELDIGSILSEEPVQLAWSLPTGGAQISLSVTAQVEGEDLTWSMATSELTRPAR